MTGAATRSDARPAQADPGWEWSGPSPTLGQRLWDRHVHGWVLAPAVWYACRRAMRRARDRNAALARQADRVGRIVDHAMRNVPFYRRYYGSHAIPPGAVRSVTDLAALPFLTKRHLQDHLPGLLARDRGLRFCEVRETSGTTGRPIMVAYPLEAQFEMYVRLEARLPQLGIRPSDFPLLGDNFVYISDTEPMPHLRRWNRRLPIFRLSRFVKRDIRPQYHGDRHRLLSELHRCNPVLIHGKPTSLIALADLIDAVDPVAYGLRPKLVLTGAEQLTAGMRDRLERGFACPVYDSYGLQEVGTFACECAHRTGLHVEDDSVVVEVLDGERPVKPGESGEIVVTDLCNWTMPILRYRTGDIGRVDPTPCPCGVTYPRLVSLEGRVVDFFVTPQGESFNPFVLLGPLPALGLPQFQLVQRTPHEVAIRYTGPASEATVEEAMRPAIHARMGTEVRIVAERVASLDRPGRKTRLYVNEMVSGG